MEIPDTCNQILTFLDFEDIAEVFTVTICTRMQVHTSAEQRVSLVIKLAGLTVFWLTCITYYLLYLNLPLFIKQVTKYYVLFPCFDVQSIPWKIWEVAFQATKNKNPWGMPSSILKHLPPIALDQIYFQHILHEKCMIHLSINYSN